MKTKTGYATLLVLGFLAVMTLYGITYMTACCYFLKTSKNYMVSVKSQYLAEAGINRAIADLKVDTRTNFAYADGFSWTEGVYFIVTVRGEQSLGEGTYEINDVKDEARKTNINNTENPNLAQILKNVRYIMIESYGMEISLTEADCDNIAANAPYETKEEVKRAPGVDDTKYKEIKDFITIHSYKDPNCGNRAPINVNTVDGYTFQAVLLGLSDGITTISKSDVWQLLNYIKSDIFNNGPYGGPDGWKRFEAAVKTALSGDLLKTGVVVRNCNPNADKTGLTVKTTEFCFHSGGYYSLQSTGIVKKGGVEVSEKKINTIVKVYDIWNQTTMEQFRGEDADYDRVLDSGEDVNGNGQLDVPNYERITWKDSCFVTPDGQTIENSLKLGFWDDFADENYSKAQWKAYRGARVFYETSWGGMMCIYKSGSQPRIDLYDTRNPDRWKFQTQYVRLNLADNHGQEGSNQVWLHSEAARFCFKGRPGTTTDSSVIHTLRCVGTPWYGDLPSAFELWIRVVGNPLNNTYKDEAVGYHPPRFSWQKYEVWSYPNNTYAQEKYKESDENIRVLQVSKAMGAQYASPGVVRVYHPYWDSNQRSYWTWIQVIPAKDASDSKYGKGIYTSIRFTPKGYPVDWGTIYGTITLPGVADDENQTVKFETSADGYGSTIESGGRIAGNNSTSINYRAILQTKGTTAGDYVPFSIPVLEDVYITYMDSTQILYWGE